VDGGELETCWHVVGSLGWSGMGGPRQGGRVRKGDYITEGGGFNVCLPRREV
jgi:hypothetical protein